MLELPGLARRVGDQALDTLLEAQIANPAGQQAGLEEDDAGVVLVDEPAQLLAAAGDRGEPQVVCRAINTGDALVLAQVDGQNGVGGGGGLGRCRRHRASSVGAMVVEVWQLSRYHTPRLAWIL